MRTGSRLRLYVEPLIYPSPGEAILNACLPVVLDADQPPCVGITRLGGLGYLKVLAPPEWILRFVEGRLNLLGRLPHYVSVDQKTYGRFGVLPTSNSPDGASPGVALGLAGTPQRLAHE